MIAYHRIIQYPYFHLKRHSSYTFLSPFFLLPEVENTSVLTVHMFI